LADEYWHWLLERDLDLRMKRGLRIESLPDISFAKSQADAAFAKSLFNRIQRIRPQALSLDEQATLGVLDFEASAIVDGASYYWLRFMVTPYTSPLPVANRAFTSYRFHGSDDLQAYLDLLRKYPAFLESLRSHLDGQAARGIRLPKPEIALVQDFLRSYIKDPKQSIFYVDRGRITGAMPTERVSGFQRQIATLIEEEINPKLRTLSDSLVGQYLERAPDAVGLWQYPNGRRFYEYLVKFHTTIDVSPQEVQRIGLAIVEDTENKMEQARTRLGYAGRKEEFTRFIKTDPRFFPQGPDEVADKMARAISRIQPKLSSVFLHLQQAPYGIERLPLSLEGAQTFGIYHQPSATEPRGIYYFNGSDLKNRTLLNADVLIYHELMPGHHLQLNLQRQNNALPEFRRYGFYTAYGEGWACYATTLAEELGLYDDPYDYYGYLAMNMFYSVRLVVDTGMNYLGWTRAQATEFMRAHLIESDAQISTETLRYAVDYPGQALAYRMGAREMQELRDRVRRALGKGFDLRQFHDWVFTVGNVPLPILAKYVDRQVQQVLSASADNK
jgi:uncharacterized protein (DUF885 family)